MKKIIAFFLLITLYGATNFAAGQLMIQRPENEILDEPIGTELTLKKSRLSNGVTLQYAEQGSFTGTPVIFLHGITDSWHSFESVLSLLPDNIHAFAISQRGHGDSDRPLQGYTPKDFAADIADFIHLHKLKSAFIVGHSMGGVIAQRFVLDYPQLSKGLVIIGSAASFKNNPGMPEFYNQVQGLADPMDKAFMDEFQKATLAKPIDPNYYRVLVAEGMKVPVRVFKEALLGLMEADMTHEIKNIKSPVLIVWGAKDSFITRENQAQLVKEIGHSAFIVYESTGHALHWEEPNRFVNDLVGFINRSTGSKI